MTRQRHTIIESLGVYLPDNVVSTAELLRGCVKEVRFPLEQFTGIVTRRVAASHEFSIDLARRAIADCLARSTHEPAEIDLLIACNICRLDAPNRVSYEPGTAARIRGEFGFDNALAFDVANACAGMFTGIWIASTLIDADVVRRALVFSGEYITHLSRTAQREIDGYMDPRLACLTVGDAGAAVILRKSTDEDAGFVALDIFTLGKYSSVCVAKPTERSHGGATMLTDPMQAAALGLEPAANHAARMLAQSALPLAAIQHIVPHQISTISINEGTSEIGKKFNVDLTTRVVNNLAERGNTASNTHFVALRDQILNHRIQTGDGVLFCIAGSGISVGTAVYKFDDLPDRLRGARSVPAPARDATVDAARRGGTFAHSAANRVRIESIGCALPDEAEGMAETRELAARAAEACLRSSAFPARDIELLLSAGTYRTGYVVEPAAATMVADDLRMNHDYDRQDARTTFAFDLLNGSVGYLNACHVAAEMIRAKRCKNAMIVAAECRPTAPGGQAALNLREVGSAITLAPSLGQPTGFERFLFRCFPEYIDALQSYATQENGGTHLVALRSRHAENYLLQCMRETIDEILAAEGLSPTQIRRLLLPQISRPFLARAARVLGVASDALIDVTEEGDLFTSSLPLAWKHAQESGLVQSGDRVLFVSAGAGIQVGCAIYYC